MSLDFHYLIRRSLSPTVLPMNIAKAVRMALSALLFSIFISGASVTTGFAADGMTTYSFQADGLACPFCAYGIEKRVQKLDGVVSVSTDIASGKVIIDVQSETELKEAAVNEAVNKAGFTMRSFKKE
tara:strand:+ start:158 stop:538 length:381 start_codon:yes stop_codon:yes gene_type:complete